MLLPPLYRILAKLILLPNRRFYTPATEYKRVPLRRGWERLGPSLVDLGELGVGSGAAGEVVSVTGRGQRDVEDGGLKNRNPYFGGLENAKEEYISGLPYKNGVAHPPPKGTTLVVGHEYEEDNYDYDSDTSETEGVSDKTPVPLSPSPGRPLRKRYDAEGMCLFFCSHMFD